MIRFFVLLIAIFVPSVGLCQVGQWNGRSYTPSSFPRGTWCNCEMCQSLRAQWRQWSASQYKVGQPASYEVAPVPTVGVDCPGYTTKMETVYETRYRQVKRCVNGRCFFVTEAYRVPVTRQVRVAIPKQTAKPKVAPKKTTSVSRPDPLRVTELVETPMPVVESMLSVLDMPPRAKYFDIGSGDGRFLGVAAVEYDVIAVGVELDAQRAAESRRDLRGLDTLVFAGDATEMDLTEADYASMYLYPELMKKIVAKLPDRCRIVSYSHEIPGLENERHTVRVGDQEHVFYYARKGDIEEKLVTFGL